MPIYEYYCKNCNKTFDQIKRFGEDEDTTCPDCKSICPKVPFNPPSIIFKGSGFYVTDSKVTPPSKPSTPSSSGHKTRKRSLE